MSVSKQLKLVNNSADELLATIENGLWGEAEELCRQWDARIRKFMRSLSAEQFISMRSEIENIASQNTSIIERLIKLRAKVLTQIQENNSSRSAIQLYNNTF